MARYKIGDKLKLEATPAKNYKFSHWTVNGTREEHNNPWDYDVTRESEGILISAEFIPESEPQPETVTITTHVVKYNDSGDVIVAKGTIDKHPIPTPEGTQPEFEHETTQDGKIYTVKKGSNEFWFRCDRGAASSTVHIEGTYQMGNGESKPISNSDWIKLDTLTDNVVININVIPNQQQANLAVGVTPENSGTANATTSIE